jgi:hypothetical protein
MSYIKKFYMIVPKSKHLLEKEDFYIFWSLLNANEKYAKISYPLDKKVLDFHEKEKWRKQKNFMVDHIQNIEYGWNHEELNLVWHYAYDAKVHWFWGAHHALLTINGKIPWSVAGWLKEWCNPTQVCQFSVYSHVDFPENWVWTDKERVVCQGNLFFPDVEIAWDASYLYLIEQASSLTTPTTDPFQITLEPIWEDDKSIGFFSKEQEFLEKIIISKNFFINFNAPL